MKTNTVAELIQKIDTSYMTQSEIDLAIARAQRAEFLTNSIIAAVNWMKTKLTFKASVKVTGQQPA